MQIEKTIDEASNKGNNSLEEHIPLVFTAACTAIEISVLERETLLEVLEETFFLHESFSCLWVDKYGDNVGKGTDIINRYKGHSREGIMKYKRRGRDHQVIAASLSFCVYVRGEICVST